MFDTVAVSTPIAFQITHTIPNMVLHGLIALTSKVVTCVAHVCLQLDVLSPWRLTILVECAFVDAQANAECL